MHRINSVNARANQNGTGKAGFHDNADLAGQDATYLTPTWCNTVQEEIANAVEGFGTTLNTQDNAQLFKILNSLSNDINNLANQVNTLESALSSYEDVAIGDLYITTKVFENAAAVATHKGFGTWERFGNGQVLLTAAQTGNATAPSWMFDVKNTGGSDTVILDIANLPPHNFEFTNTWATRADQPENLPEGATRIGDGDGHANDDVVDSLINQKTNTLGSGDAFSVVQNSIVVAAWLRTA